MPEISWTLNPGRPNYCVGQTPQSISVTTAVANILPSNNNRTGLYVRNDGNKTVWLAFDNDAEQSKGIKLGRDEVIVFDVGFISRGRLSGIADSGTSDLRLQEFNRK